MNAYKNSSSDGFPWGTIFLFLVLLLFAGAIIESTDTQISQTQTRYDPATETWRDYIFTSPTSNVDQQLMNMQQLILALRNDITNLPAQYIDIQSALYLLQSKLDHAQARFEAESKRQSRDQILFTIYGIIGGFIVGLLTPGEESRRRFLVNILKAIKKPGDSSELKHHSNKQNNVSHISREKSIDTKRSSRPRRVDRQKRSYVVNMRSQYRNLLTNLIEFWRDSKLARIFVFTQIILVLAFIAITIWVSL